MIRNNYKKSEKIKKKRDVEKKIVEFNLCSFIIIKNI
jgi:hypothetical protein